MDPKLMSFRYGKYPESQGSSLLSLLTSCVVANHKAPIEPSSPRSSLDVGDATVEEAMEETKAFLDTAGDNEEDGDSEHDQGSKLFRCLLQVVASLLCLGVLFAGYDLYRASTAPSIASPEQTPQLRHCGNDAITARNRGCMFDPISIAWLPESCHDFELTKEFLAVERWHFWTRPDTSDAMSLANVMQGQHSTLFVSETYLRHRCVFAWRKLHRAVLNSTAVDAYTTGWDGMMECEELFKDGRTDGGARYEVTVGYPECRAEF